MVKKPESFMITRAKISAVRVNDSNAVGVYLENSCWSCSDRTVTLVKELPPSRCRKQAVSASNSGYRKMKERSWAVVLAKFKALTSELRIARILERKLTARAEKYSHFELKNITLF